MSEPSNMMLHLQPNGEQHPQPWNLSGNIPTLVMRNVSAKGMSPPQVAAIILTFSFESLLRRRTLAT